MTEEETKPDAVEDAIKDDLGPEEKLPEAGKVKEGVVNEGLLLVSKHYKAGGAVTKEEFGEETIAVKPFAVKELASVQSFARMTINLGDYESVQIGVSCSLPCYPEEMDEAFKAAKAFTDLELNKQVKGIKEFRKGKAT